MAAPTADPRKKDNDDEAPRAGAPYVFGVVVLAVLALILACVCYRRQTGEAGEWTDRPRYRDSESPNSVELANYGMRQQFV